MILALFERLGFTDQRLGRSYESRRVEGSRSLTSHSLRSSSSVIGGMPHGHSTGIYGRWPSLLCRFGIIAGREKMLSPMEGSSQD